MLGGRTCSEAASSPRVGLPSRSTVARAETCVDVTPSATCWRSRRDSRRMASRKRAASSGSESDAPRRWPGCGPLESGPLESGPLESGPLESGPLESGPLESGPLESGGPGISRPRIRARGPLASEPVSTLLPRVVVVIVHHSN